MRETQKLAAILIADVVAYSQFAGADKDLTLACLRGLRSDLIDLAIGARYGRIVKRTGDGGSLNSVASYTPCAIEVQNDTPERNAGPQEGHVGVQLVEEEGGHLFGAARVIER
jgi:adenylate cyclase